MGRPRMLSLALAALAASFVAGASEAPTPKTCEKIVLRGEVSAGHEWKAPLGEGWVFRVVPIPKDKTAADMGGWDLVVDRDEPAGFPDALLLATPPYNLINPREIGTTYGLRAQDAIGWNPRNFRFITNRSTFHQAQKLYLLLNRYGELGGKPGKDVSERKEKSLKRALQRFEKLDRQSLPGEFQILNARLTPGVGAVKPYAANWALKASATPHTDVVPPGTAPAPLGELERIRFSITLWLPGTWRAEHGVELPRATCPE
jgi:hypothetical protein